MKPRILHLSADYPDSLDPAKTSAIRGLVEGTRDQFDHFVVSLNRRNGWAGGRVDKLVASEGMLACRYHGPPAAVAIESVMQGLASALRPAIEEQGFKPDLIQGHKLTVEGYLARHLAALLGVPYALTLQGNTDQKLMRQRPDRNRAIRRIWHDAASVMAFAPWTEEWCRERLGQPAQPVAVIPCLIPHDAILPPAVTPPLVRTAFNLDFWRNKNVTTLLAAVARLVQGGREVRLEIAGGGSPAAVAAIEQLIGRHGLTDRVALVGPIAAERIQAWFNGAALFALPSRRESFGMVFAEALLGGTPVIHPQGAAIDGYFPGASFARGVAAEDPAALAETIGAMLDDNPAIKAELATAQAGPALQRFRRDSVLGDYTWFLRGALR
jgi:glycosyltransferase involved in cell wall biosynthesis